MACSGGQLRRLCRRTAGLLRSTSLRQHVAMLGGQPQRAWRSSFWLETIRRTLAS